ncbi:uncharacterized protein [Aristolochia californica]|uniref:uncharacterized protein n=1 Tax=Aristolochia californica TaxID=171875 RepID=UPI0035D84B47
MEAVQGVESDPRKSFSSSSSSSSEDFFQIDPKELAKAKGSHGDDAPFPSTPGSPEVEKVVHHGLPPKYGGGPPSGEFIRSSGTLSDLPPMGNPFTADSYGINTQSPPVQVMGKNDIPDPYRIPSTVFARTKSTTPMEWSVASNESLFSIHVGNNSFSRDHALLIGRSGELTNFPSPNEPFPPPPTGPETPTSTWDPRSGEGLEKPGMTEAANAQAMKDVLRAAADEHVTEAASPVVGGGNNSPSISRHSDGSGASIQSFAFPILIGDGGRTVSAKVVNIEPPHHQHQSQPPPLSQKQQSELAQSPDAAPSVTPNSGHARWIPCFACCPFCC